MSIYSTAITSSNSRGEKFNPNTSLERDIFAPNFELIMRGGKGAPPHIITDDIKKYIDEVSYEDNADQFDHVIIRLKNQSDQEGGGQILSLIDSVLFAEGQLVEIKMGYGKGVRTVGACEILRKTPHFPEAELPELTIEGYDLLHRAARNRPRGGKTYDGLKDSQIITDIGTRNGFVISNSDKASIANIQNTKVVYGKGPGEEPRVQHLGVSDYEYAKKLADYHGFSLFCRFDPEKEKFFLYFRPHAPEKQKEVLTFTYAAGEIGYHSSLLSFTPTMDVGDMSTNFEVLVIKGETSSVKVDFYKNLTVKTQDNLNEFKNRKFTGKLDQSGGRLRPLGDAHEIAFKAFGRSFRFLPGYRFRSEEAARHAITKFIERQKKNMITATGVILGHEGVQSGQIHMLTGLGDQFSGKYFFTKVVHRITRDGGYKTEFTCHKVISGDIVRENPALEISSTDKIIDRIKGFKDKKPKAITGAQSFGTD